MNENEQNERSKKIIKLQRKEMLKLGVHFMANQDKLSSLPLAQLAQVAADYLQVPISIGLIGKLRRDLGWAPLVSRPAERPRREKRDNSSLSKNYGYARICELRRTQRELSKQVEQLTGVVLKIMHGFVSLCKALGENPDELCETKREKIGIRIPSVAD